MLPHVGPSFLRVALIAEFVERIGLDHLRSKPAMVVVAIRAFQLSFSDGMVGGFILLGSYALVA
jgi:hypothetical protein